MPDGPLPEVWIAFDVETTGLYPGPDRIVEIAAVRFERGEEAGEFSALVNPGKRLPAIITRITGLRDADLAGAPPIAKILPDFLAFVADAPMVAHNAPFDLGFVAQALASSGVRAGANAVIDTLEIARRVLPRSPNHKLPTMLGRYGIDPGRAHRAASDAAATYRLFEKLLSDRGIARPWESTWGALRKLAAPIVTLARPLPRLAPAEKKVADAVEAAIAEGRDLKIEYESGQGAVTVRTVTPRGIFPYNGSMQLVAYCRLRKDERQFRLDCMEILEVVAREPEGGA